jgi:glycosyltransferase involved in cell wall biosynthesis
MRVLLVNQYFPPDASATAVLAAEVAEAFAASGHRLTVLAGRPSYGVADFPRWKLVRREVRGPVLVERVGSTAFDRARMPGRLANYVSYLLLASLRIPFHRPDVVLAMTDPPLAVLVGVLASVLRGVPLVYNIRDLHPDMAVAAGLLGPGLAHALWERLHRFALRRARRVVVIGEDMRGRVVAKGVPADRVAVVRDGARPRAPAGAELPVEVMRRIRDGFRFVVVHAGNLGYSGAWETLLEAAALLSGDGAGMVFVGGGASRAALEARSARLANVRWVDPRPDEEAAAVLASADLHLVTLRRGLEGLVVPSKLYPVLAAGKPVLAVAPGGTDLAAIVRTEQCGWVADPDDPAAVVSAIREAMSDPAELERRARRAAAAALRFDRSRLLRDLVREVEQA